ncbi:MAG TPA: adhesin [Proteus sp.]|uniref:SfmH family fimbriae-like adhesin protein n=1 Tax=Proteus hauseri ATCC 700826 TaxID=1354271 RepID=A0AAJ3HS82_PROHU|nr:fimbrial protein [Proteus hauseri]OAT46681.1 SfmH family fimbriae-like adhesin protein [Proteus hauseri ATCC 700826]QAV24876.1 adhesin [Proteus hauseri]HCH49577.1 adhesin [Proteus sp. (in: enterobacteria)]
MIRTLLFTIIAITSQSAYSVSCLSGCNTNEYSTLSGQLSKTENKAGVTKDASEITLTNRTSLKWNAGQAQTWATYSNGNIPAANTNNNDWNYSKIDDYISVALRVTNSCRTIYVPYNVPTLSVSCGSRTYTEGEESVVSTRKYQTKIRIDKAIISGTYVKNIFVGEFGFCQPQNCSSKQVVLTKLFLNLSMTVPQSCVINSGQVLNIDFDNIPASSFKAAGEKAVGVNTISRNLNIQCDNIEASADLTMRLQADTVAGNAIVSNNKSVGFVVANSTGSELTPNDLSSFIPFKLNGNLGSNVTINIYPVSVDGKTPTEGAVTSSGFLRVDFP